MAKSKDFSSTLMSEVAIAAAKAGWEPADFSKLCQNQNLLKLVFGVLHGTHKIEEIENMIDCDVLPFIPEGWKIEQHQEMGYIQFDPQNTTSYFSRKQQEGGSSTGHELLDELRGKKVLNATVLEYLLQHPSLIPREWKYDENGNIRRIVFGGTVYSHPGGDLHVLYLCCTNDDWCYGTRRLDYGFDCSYSVLLAV